VNQGHLIGGLFTLWLLLVDCIEHRSCLTVTVITDFLSASVCCEIWVSVIFLARDKASLDIFWLKDDSLEDAANLPAPDVIAAEIVEDLQAALDEFALIAEDLRKN